MPTCLGKYHRDPEGLLVGMSNGNVCLWDLRTSTILREYNGESLAEPRSRYAVGPYVSRLG